MREFYSKCKEHEQYMSKLSDGNWHWLYAANVTHWMPIPELDEYNIND